MSEPTAEHLRAARDFWHDTSPCPNDDHGGRVGAHYYRSECVYCLAVLLASREQAVREANDRLRCELRGADDEIRYQAKRAEAAEARLKRVENALRELVWIIDKAGLLNLSNGVQLGQTSWYVKANDRLEGARAALAAAQSSEEPKRLLGHAFVGIDASACAALVLPSGLRCGRPASEHER